MKHFRPRLSRRAFWVLCALLVCLRLALTGFQQAYIWVGGAPLDDELMFRAANHITAGQWLGAYDYLTLSKAMFFPVWLALCMRISAVMQAHNSCRILSAARRSGAGRRCWRRLPFRRCGAKKTSHRAAC